MLEQQEKLEGEKRLNNKIRMIENQKKRNEEELKELKVTLERDKAEIQELRAMKVEAETKQQTAITELN